MLERYGKVQPHATVSRFKCHPSAQEADAFRYYSKARVARFRRARLGVTAIAHHIHFDAFEPNLETNRQEVPRFGLPHDFQHIFETAK
jgi:hypothetical protein